MIGLSKGKSSVLTQKEPKTSQLMISCSRTIKRQIVYSVRPFQIQRIDALFNYPIDTKERGKPGCLTTKFKPIIHELKLICMRKSLKRVCSYPELIHVVPPFSVMLLFEQFGSASSQTSVATCINLVQQQSRSPTVAVPQLSIPKICSACLFWCQTTF